MIVSHFPGGGGGDKPINELYSYSSSNQPIDDGDGNWRVKFLSSGTLTVVEDMFVDIFAVGGGGNGGGSSGDAYYGGGGGGGGYTYTTRNVLLEKGKSYTVTVGAALGASSLVGEDNIVLCEAAGGKSGSTRNGGNGGSGGGPGAYASWSTGYPGSDGADGTANTSGSTTSDTMIGGTGQGKTTREFEEADGDLYSGGGGGGKSPSGSGSSRPGAEGGGGDGASNTARATAGGENTGGGGGGGAGFTGYTSGAAGGSGIVIIRNARIATA